MARFLRARSGMAGFIKAFRRLHARSLEKKWESWAKSYEAMGPVEQAAAWNAVGRKQRRYLERQLGMRRPLRTETQAALNAIVEIFTLLKEEWPRLTDKLGNAPATRGLWSTLDQNRRKAFKQELCLATVASNAMALRNLFPSDQAERLIAKYTAALAKAMELDVSYVEQVFREYQGRQDRQRNSSTAAASDAAFSVFGTGEVLCERVGWGVGYSSPEHPPEASLLAPGECAKRAMLLAEAIVKCSGVWEALTEHFDILPD